MAQVLIFFLTNEADGKQPSLNWDKEARFTLGRLTLPWVNLFPYCLSVLLFRFVVGRGNQCSWPCSQES